MSDDPPVSPELEELERKLAAIRFEPRASFGPELLGRVRRGETPRVDRRARFPWRLRPLPKVLAPLAALTALALFVRPPTPVMVDRCCYDLDGGGQRDDGILVVAERDGRVHRLQVYEDLDGSHRLSPGDVVRLDRGGTLAMRSDAAEGLVTTRHCCVDLDGGGPDDDALLVIGVPPDRIMMAAIYEQRADGRRRHPPTDVSRLR